MTDQQNPKPCGNVYIFIFLLITLLAATGWSTYLLYETGNQPESTNTVAYTSTVNPALTNIPVKFERKISQQKWARHQQQIKNNLLIQQLKEDNQKLQTQHAALKQQQLSYQSSEKNDLLEINQKLTSAKLTLTIKQQELDDVLIQLNNASLQSGQRAVEIEKHLKELNQLKKLLENTDIQISDLKNRFTVFEMKQEILFNEGEAELNKSGRHAISALAKIFQQFPNRHIAIQGHTDNQTVGKSLQKKFTSNWELAAARSASAIHYLQNVEKISPERMILVSYSQYHPIHSNESAQGQANNRRIEIILMPKDFNFFRESTDKN